MGIKILCWYFCWYISCELEKNRCAAMASLNSVIDHTSTEPAAVGAMLRMFDDYHGTLITRCALRLAPLVFVRPGELRAAEWKDIDLEAGEWRYLVSKTKTDHIVPLSRQAVAILKELQN